MYFIQVGISDRYIENSKYKKKKVEVGYQGVREFGVRVVFVGCRFFRQFGCLVFDWSL